MRSSIGALCWIGLALTSACGRATAPPAAASMPPKPSAAPVVAPTAPAASSSSVATASTRYRVGDYVVYSYSGSLLAGDVTLTEEILTQDGLRLEILVQAKRGTEERSWVQVVTDTPENRKAEKLDELYRLEGTKRVRLANEGNADAYRLYEWVIPPRGESPRDKTRQTRQLEVAGQRLEASCATTRQDVGQREAEVEFCESESFLWTHVRTLMRATDDGEVLYRQVVSEAGRRGS